jgi:hypothetical protein
VTGLIPAVVVGTEGASYEVLDDAAAARRATHSYLEDVDVFGRRTLHGPLAVDRGSHRATGGERGPQTGPMR